MSLWTETLFSVCIFLVWLFFVFFLLLWVSAFGQRVCSPQPVTAHTPRMPDHKHASKTKASGVFEPERRDQNLNVVLTNPNQQILLSLNGLVDCYFYSAGCYEKELFGCFISLDIKSLWFYICGYEIIVYQRRDGRIQSLFLYLFILLDGPHMCPRWIAGDQSRTFWWMKKKKS